MQDYYDKMSESSRQTVGIANKALEEGNVKSAIKILEKVSKVEEHPEFILLALAKSYIEDEKYAKAIKIYDSLAKDNSENKDFLKTYGTACMENRNYVKVMKIAQKGAQAYGDDFYFIYLITGSLMGQEEFPKAIKVLSEALLSKKYENEKAFICLGLFKCYFYEYNYEKCLKYLEILSGFELTESQKAELVDNYSEVIDAFFDQGLMEEARKSIDILIKILPDNDELKEFSTRLNGMQRYNDVADKIESDPKVPETILAIILPKLLDEGAMGMTKEQMESFDFMNKFRLLDEYKSYGPSIKYLKTQYPDVYAIEKEFFEACIDSKKRKDKILYYRMNLHRYETVYEDLIFQMENEEIEDYNFEVRDEFAEDMPPSKKKEKEKRGKYIDNVVPFKRDESKTKKKDE